MAIVRGKRRTVWEAGAAQVPPFAPDWCFFLDIDGTLLDFTATPAATRADGGLRRLLQRLAAACGGAVALISGRHVADIDRVFAPLQVPVAGQHGLERRDASGRMHYHELPVAGLRDAARVLRQVTARYAGLMLEDKGSTLALHFRRAPALSAVAEEAVHAVLAQLGNGFELQTGKMVFEIKPGGRDKGTAVAEFVAEAPFHGRAPVFVGDDGTDEYGFRLINDIGGHAVKVGPGDSTAPWRLADATAVRAWLDDYAARYAPAAASGLPA